MTKEVVGTQSSSLFAHYHKQSKEWTFTNKVHSRLGNIQPSVVQIDEYYLFKLSVVAEADMVPWPDGFIVRTESKRRWSKVWSQGEDTQFPNPNAAVDLIKLKNGHLVMIYNDSNQGHRNPLTMRVSTDSGSKDLARCSKHCQYAG